MKLYSICAFWHLTMFLLKFKSTNLISKYSFFHIKLHLDITYSVFWKKTYSEFCFLITWKWNKSTLSKTHPAENSSLLYADHDVKGKTSGTSGCLPPCPRLHVTGKSHEIFMESEEKLYKNTFLAKAENVLREICK